MRTMSGNEPLIIPKRSPQEARLTIFYIVTSDGRIALRLKGSTKTRTLRIEENWKYLVEIYLGIIRQITVIDIPMKEVIYYRQDNIDTLMPEFLRPIMAEEMVKTDGEEQ